MKENIKLCQKEGQYREYFNSAGQTIDGQMMKSLRIKLMFYCLFFSTTGVCQNLVANWSFEDTIPCVANPNIGTLETAPPWQSFKQSPDFQSMIYCGAIGISFGFQPPKSGSSFAGIVVYDSMATFVNEMFGQELIDSLIAGHTYCISFFVSLSGQSRFAVDRIGALFTSFEPDPVFLNNYTAIPQIESQSGTAFIDTLNWVQISDSFTAQGGEKFITLGNFHNINDFLVVPVTYPAALWGSYYYFDDISVTDCTVGIEELNSPDFSVYPNPVYNDQAIFLEFSSEKMEGINIQIYSSVGQMVYQSQQLTSSKIELLVNFAPGIYYCEVEGKSGISIQKIVILGK